MSGTKIGREVERKFVCRLAGPVPDPATGTLMEQVYLSTRNPQVRLRRMGEKYVQTVKERGSGMEVEFVLAQDVGRALFDLAPTRAIVKTRYDEGPWEVDVFHGRFEGLVFLEIEDPPETLPAPPGWIEVIEEISMGNVRMATMEEDAIRALVARSTAPAESEEES